MGVMKEVGKEAGNATTRWGGLIGGGTLVGIEILKSSGFADEAEALRGVTGAGSMSVAQLAAMGVALSVGRKLWSMAMKEWDLRIERKEDEALGRRIAIEDLKNAAADSPRSPAMPPARG